MCFVVFSSSLLWSSFCNSHLPSHSLSFVLACSAFLLLSLSMLVLPFGRQWCCLHLHVLKTTPRNPGIREASSGWPRNTFAIRPEVSLDCSVEQILYLAIGSSGLGNCHLHCLNPTFPEVDVLIGQYHAGFYHLHVPGWGLSSILPREVTGRGDLRNTPGQASHSV